MKFFLLFITLCVLWLAYEAITAKTDPRDP